MKHSNDYFKVVNAVINTLNQGDCVAYVSGGQGGSGFGLFDPDEDFRELRIHLLDDFSTVEDLDVDDEDFGELFNEWVEYDQFDSTFDFYEFTDGESRLQVMINPDNYVNSYELRDMISNDYDFETAEITTGMNGYPRGLRGCVLLNGGDTTFDGAQRIADLYGVEVVELRKCEGWQLWECRGNASGLFNYADFLSSHNDNVQCFHTWKEYAEALREWAYNLKSSNVCEEMAQRAKMDELADLLEQREPMGENEFVWINSYDVTDYTLENCMVDHFSYDTHNYTLALDCMVIDY